MMTPAKHVRSGITLTEILISILIMGVGLVSLASLFPVGLERIRQGTRMSRSALLTGAAINEVGAKNLLGPNSFESMPWYGLTSNTNPLYASYRNTWGGTGIAFDPWVQDIPPVPGIGVARTAYGTEGIPVCYDPLWWRAIYRDSGGPQNPGNSTVSNNPTSRPFESRFGRNMDRNSIPPTTLDNAVAPPIPPAQGASAHGLQRLTNEFLPIADDRVVIETFVARDDPVLQQDGEISAAGYENMGSPILPAMRMDPTRPTTNVMAFDWVFTWMFTGRRTDAGNGSVYDGDIVIQHNRPFALDPSTTSNLLAPAGERVVEGIFGYGGAGARVTLLDGSSIAATNFPGYSPNARTVLLRWPISELDPEVRVGSWIADVTYEQFATRESRFRAIFASPASSYYNPAVAEFYRPQRCNWYRVARRSDIEEINGYRQMVVTTETPVKDKTLIWGSGGAQNGEVPGAAGDPVFRNAALIAPAVVNVFPKVFFAR